MQQKFMNKATAGKKDINNEIFMNYFNYQHTLFLVKDLISAKQDKNQKIVSNVNDGLIDFTNDIDRKEIPENQVLKK